jgi:hypothetical protein
LIIPHEYDFTAPRATTWAKFDNEIGVTSKIGIVVSQKDRISKVSQFSNGGYQTEVIDCV